MGLLAFQALWAVKTIFVRPKQAPRVLIGEVALGETDIVGVVETFDEEVEDPLTGRHGVALEYHASAPSAVSRAYAGLLGTSADMEVRARQAVDFLISDGSGSALVRVHPGHDVPALHRTLAAEYGLELRSETALVRTGQRVRVRGKVVDVCDESPMRRGRWRAIIVANRVDVIEA
jgi:hypothetical protein